MRIIFIRHGEPDYANDCLTGAGRRQAQLAAQRLREERPAELWSSPLGRARETAQPASDLLGLPVRELEFLREVTWGSTDGTPIFAGGHPWAIVDEMARQGIGLNRPDWRDSPFFRTNRVVECVEGIGKGLDEWLAGYGYLREGAYYRREREETEERSVALFCHGGSSAAAMGHLLDLPFPSACAMLQLDFTGVTVVRLDRSPGAGTLPRLELSNDIRHLRREGRIS